MDILELLGGFILWGSTIWFFIITGILLIAFVVSEKVENGFIGFWAFLIYCIGMYFWSNLELLEIFTWKNVGIYLLIGVIYALIKTYFHGRRVRLSADKSNSYLINPERTRDEKEKSDNLKQYNRAMVAAKGDAIRGLKENVFRWFLMWPISALVWILGDLFVEAWNWIWDNLGKVFNSLFSLGFGKTDDNEA